MKANKIILFNILIFIAIINTLYIYLVGGINALTISNSWMPLLTITILWSCSLLILLSFVFSRVLHKKNMLRISAILLIVMLIMSFIGRTRELLLGTFCISCWFNTILFIILLVVNILILKELYNLVNGLFIKRKEIN